MCRESLIEPEIPCGSAELVENRAVVERRQKQAAKVVPIPLLWRGARQGGVVDLRLGDYGHPRRPVPDLPAAGRRRSTYVHVGVPSRRIQDILSINQRLR